MQLSNLQLYTSINYDREKKFTKYIKQASTENILQMELYWIWVINILYNALDNPVLSSASYVCILVSYQFLQCLRTPPSRTLHPNVLHNRQNRKHRGPIQLTLVWETCTVKQITFSESNFWVKLLFTILCIFIIRHSCGLNYLHHRIHNKIKQDVIIQCCQSKQKNYSNYTFQPLAPPCSRLVVSTCML